MDGSDTFDINSFVSMEFANVDGDVQAPQYNLTFNTNPYPGENSGLNAQPQHQQMGFPQPLSMHTPLTAFDNTQPPGGHKRNNHVSLPHHLSSKTQRRLVGSHRMALCKPVMLEGTQRFVTATIDDRKTSGNCLVVCDISGIRIRNPNQPAVTSCIDVGNKNISWIHSRKGSQDDHYLYCAAGLGDLDTYHVTDDGKQVTKQSSITLQDDYIRQMAFKNGLIASGGYCRNVLIHQETPQQLQLVHSISMAEVNMSSLSLVDAKASVHAGCLRYTLEHGVYVVSDFQRSGRQAASINVGLGELYCHHAMGDHLVALAGLDHTVRVFDVRNNSLVNETKLPDIGPIGCIEENSAGTAVIVTGMRNVLTFRRAAGHGTAEQWDQLEPIDETSKARTVYEASFANLEGEDQRSADTIVYSNSSGEIGVITHDYLFDQIPQNN